MVPTLTLHGMNFFLYFMFSLWQVITYRKLNPFEFKFAKINSMQSNVFDIYVAK